MSKKNRYTHFISEDKDSLAKNIFEVASFEGIRNIQQQAVHDVFESNKKGAYFQAIDIAQIALRRYSKNHVLLCLLAQAYHGLGNYTLTKNSLTKAVEIQPRFFQALVLSGNLHRDYSEYIDAIKFYKRAIAIDANSSFLLVSIGKCWIKLGNYDEAMAVFERCLMESPTNTDALYSLGILHKQSNRPDQSIAVLERALEIDSSLSHARLALSEVRCIGRGDIDEQQIRKQLLAPNLGIKDKTYLRFALAGIYEQRGDRTSYIREIKRANFAKAKEVGYSIERDIDRFALIKKVFGTGVSIRRCRSEQRHDKRVAIFVVGMPRSGTSLVEQVLASHPRVHGLGEADYLPNTISQLEVMGAGVGDLLSSEKLMALQRLYWEKVDQHDITTDFVVDKNMLNFRWVGLVLTAFPNAKIINCCRDVRAVGWSIYKCLLSGPGLGFCWRQEHIGAYTNLYLDLMQFWHCEYPDRIHNLDYQALTDDPPTEVRKLLEYCGLDWEDGCTEPHKLDRPVFTESSQQVRQPIYRGSNQAWKKFSRHLLPLKRALDDSGFDA